MIKCGYTHPGVFARFLEHLGLRHCSTKVENKHSLVLIQGGYILCLESLVSICTASLNLDTSPNL